VVVVVRRHTQVSLSSLQGVLLELVVLMDLEEGHLRGEIFTGGTMVTTRHLSIWGVLRETLRTNMGMVEVTA